jgi:hypothetical protein
VPVKSVVRSTRGSRIIAEKAKNPIPARPADEVRVGARGKYEAVQLETMRLLVLLKADDISDDQKRALTIRMARLQREVRELQSAVEDIALLSDQVVAMVIKHTC